MPDQACAEAQVETASPSNPEEVLTAVNARQGMAR